MSSGAARGGPEAAGGRCLAPPTAGRRHRRAGAMATGRGRSRPPGGADRDSGMGPARCRTLPGRAGQEAGHGGRPFSPPLSPQRTRSGGGLAAHHSPPRPEPPRLIMGAQGRGRRARCPPIRGPGRPRTWTVALRKGHDRSWMPGMALASAGRSVLGGAWGLARSVALPRARDDPRQRVWAAGTAYQSVVDSAWCVEPEGPSLRPSETSDCGSSRSSGLKHSGKKTKLAIHRIPSVSINAWHPV